MSRLIVMQLVGLRHSQKLTQTQLARKAGISQSCVSKMEARTDDQLSVGYLQKYVKALGMKLEIAIR